MSSISESGDVHSSASMNSTHILIEDENSTNIMYEQNWNISGSILMPKSGIQEFSLFMEKEY